MIVHRLQTGDLTNGPETQGWRPAGRRPRPHWRRASAQKAHLDRQCADLAIQGLYDITAVCHSFEQNE